MTDPAFKAYYDEQDDVVRYWEQRHSKWRENPDWGVYPAKQAWFRERFAHLLTNHRGKPYSAFDPSASTALDYGCGAALYAEPLLDYYDYYQGFDTSISALQVANAYYWEHATEEQKLRMNLAVYTGRPGEWSIGPDDPGYDLVLSITVLQHQPIPYRIAMIENIKSLLKPSGMYIGLEWNDAGTQAYDMPPFSREDWIKAWLPLEITQDIPAEHPDWANDHVWVAHRR